MEAKLRFQHAEALAEAYHDFRDFAADGMEFLGFHITDIQEDIAAYMQDGPRLRMVMAQRGEAKTTLAALYAVWRIIQRPATRVLIVSAGEDNSNATANMIVRMFNTWDILECFRPDRQAGDRTSYAQFDVHYSLKGLDRSPSVACAGVTSNLPGRRADLLIPDDIESNKNGMTAVQRGQLLQVSKEFTSICTHGDILYLGTPQTKDSVYNTLSQRGFEIRIWPGRYPTHGEEERYMGRLAPIIVQRMRDNPELRKGGGVDGSSGQPTDTGRYTDADLIEKEIDKGPEDFQLQYMLDTSLSDAVRQQLHLKDFVVANFSPDMVPEIIAWQAASKYEVPLGPEFPIPLSKMYYAPPSEAQFMKPKDRFMYIDPAGGGADELGYACGFSAGPYVHVTEVGGLKGGLTPENERELREICVRNSIDRIKVESNMGAGLFEINLRAILSADPRTSLLSGCVSGEYSTGQKERRIINSMVSALQRHRIILHQGVFDADIRCNRQHTAEARQQYSLFYQIANITTDRGSLPHDDRVEALAGVVREFVTALSIEENKAAEARQAAATAEFLRDPMGYGDAPKEHRGTRNAVHKRYSRRR